MATVRNGKQRLFEINAPLVGLIIICKPTNIFAHSFLVDFTFSLRNKRKVILFFCTAHLSLRITKWPA